MKADDVLNKLISDENMKPKTIVAKEWLKTANVGDVVKFGYGCIGIVIHGNNIDKSCIVKSKSILIISNVDGNFRGYVAGVLLDCEVFYE